MWFSFSFLSVVVVVSVVIAVVVAVVVVVVVVVVVAVLQSREATIKQSYKAEDNLTGNYLYPCVLENDFGWKTRDP